MMSLSISGVPTTMAKYSFSIDRDWNWIASRPWAWSCRATRIAPLVSRSKRCTMPGRNGPPLLLRLGPKWNCKRADKRSRPVSPGGMHDHARRFVDDHEILVFKEDLQRDFFRPRGLAGNFRQDDPHPLPCADAIGRLSATVVDAHAASRNHAPQMAPAVIVKVQGKQHVQTLAGLTFVDDKLDRLVGERRVTRDIASDAYLSFFGASGFGVSVSASGLRLHGFAVSASASGFTASAFGACFVAVFGVSAFGVGGFAGSVGVNDRHRHS